MKRLLAISFSFISFACLTQSLDSAFVEKAALSIGILQGGGSLLGADLEILLGQRIGLQGGIGLVDFGTALNFHLKSGIKTSFLSFTYCHQGIGDSFTQHILGGSFVYRGKKWFTAQLGLGSPLSRGPALAEVFVQPPVMLLYSVGGYFPIK